MMIVVMALASPIALDAEGGNGAKPEHRNEDPTQKRRARENHNKDWKKL
jgi:hypothetical protein